jgi:hypothetical protein
MFTINHFTSLIIPPPPATVFEMQFSVFVKPYIVG